MKLYPRGSFFTTDEFRCGCGCDFGSKEEHIEKELIDKLNMVRTMYGKPLVVTSGARCAEHNFAIGGVADSAHLPHYLTRRCRAADISVRTSEERFHLIQCAVDAGFERIGVNQAFVHLDVAWDHPFPAVFTY